MGVARKALDLGEIDEEGGVVAEAVAPGTAGGAAPDAGGVSQARQQRRVEPEAVAYIRDPDPDLDGEPAGQGLARGDALARLLLRQPLLLTHQFAFHLPDQRDRPTEAEQAEPQAVPNEITNRDTLGRLFGRHHRVSSSEALQECNA